MYTELIKFNSNSNSLTNKTLNITETSRNSSWDKANMEETNGKSENCSSQNNLSICSLTGIIESKRKIIIIT